MPLLFNPDSPLASSTSSHGTEYSRIPCDTTVVFSMPDSVKWNGKRSSRNQTQSYLSRVSTWNSNNGRPCVSPVYINTRLHQADLPLLTRLIQSSHVIPPATQASELTERSERSTINATWKMSRSVRSVQGETSEILEFVPWSIEIWSAPWP